jgi:branched-subunit amino acid transport protein
MEMAEMFSVALPEFVSVAPCAALVVPKVAVKVGGERADNEATGAATAAPKLAVTLSGALMVTVVASLLAEATLPVQFVNENPVLAVAVRLTTVPGA